MSERQADHQTILTDAWKTAVGGMDWLQSVLYGEFADHRSLSAIATDMLISFVPGVVIVTSARDAVAVILRLARHPEKREDLMEWVLLSACLIVIALPIAMAAGGVVAAGVGAVVGGIAGSELGAMLRAVMLMLLKTSKLLELIQFLQKFVKGDILKVLRQIDFTKYEKPLLLAMKKITGQLVEIVRSLRLHLESLRYFDSVKRTIIKLADWEKRFYAVQQDALRQMPKALAEINTRLAKILAQAAPTEMHAVPAGLAADKTAAAVPPKQRVRDTAGKVLATAEEKAPAASGKPAKPASAKPPSAPARAPAPQPKEPPKPPLKDNPDPLPPHDTGANTKKQEVVKPEDLANTAGDQTVSLFGFRGVGSMADILSGKAFHPYVVTGHVGYSFDGGKTIYGFGPDAAGEASAYEVVQALRKERKSYPGVIGGDTEVFREVANNPAVGRRGEIQTVYRLDIPVTKEELDAIKASHDAFGLNKPMENVFYAFPPKKGVAPAEGHYNCATFPSRLGIPIPEQTGMLTDYIPQLEQLGAPWKPSK